MTRAVTATTLHLRPLLLLSGAVLVLNMLWLIAATRHWGITGDATLMHYNAWLIDQGWAPYKSLADINSPGSYVPAWLLQHAFGNSALAWRAFDFALVAVIAAAAFVHAPRHKALTALWTGILFAAIHARDGVDQLGQRDLFAAALLLCASASLLHANRSRRPAWLAAFGLFVGAAATIKPLFAIFLLLLVACPPPPQKRHPGILCALASCLVFPALCLAWLARHHALRGFWFTLSVLAPFHATLGRMQSPELLARGFSPVLPLVLAWAGCALWQTYRRSPSTPGQAILRAGAALGLACWLLQGKGYPYQRYPLLAFLLCAMLLDFTAWLQEQGPLKIIGALALLWTCFVLIPGSIYKAGRYDAAAYQNARAQMASDLQRTARQSHLPSLDRNVQCIDTVGGCYETLDALRLQPAIGFFYDEFLFPTAIPRAVDESRKRFIQQAAAHPPALLLVTDNLFPQGPDAYTKLSQWPWFRDWLAQNYTQAAEQAPTYSIRSMGGYARVAGYRIYMKHSAAPAGKERN